MKSRIKFLYYYRPLVNLSLLHNYFTWKHEIWKHNYVFRKICDKCCCCDFKNAPHELWLEDALSCAFSTVLKIQFLQNSNPNANFFPLHLKLLFFSTKSQGQRSSWWQTDSFNHIYNIESNSDSRRGEYTGDLLDLHYSFSAQFLVAFFCRVP